MLESIVELFNYRYMILSLVKREVRGRYKGSVLGFLWNFITPLIQILVYFMVFYTLLKPKTKNYALYLTCGMIVWIFFNDSLVDGSGVFVSNSDMLKKIYFPRSVLPISIVLSKFVNYLIALGIFFGIAATFGHKIEVEALVCFPIVLATFLLFTLGCVLILSSINVFFRDVQYITSVLMMVWIWVTPIMYEREQINDELFKFILTINPVTYFMEAFQKILYQGSIPNASLICTCFLITALLLVASTAIFKFLESDFAETL